MTKDWVAWHQEYDDPTSSLSRRLLVVRRELSAALDTVDSGESGQLRLISMCGGDGRDLLPVLAAHKRGREVRALLVELDPLLVERARAAVTTHNRANVEIRAADAGRTESYLAYTPANVVLACGVFGNITLDDAWRTIAGLPRFLTPGGVVIWTRGRDQDGTEPSSRLRECFAEHGFTELSFTAPDDARFRVGVHQLAAPEAPALRPDTQLFTFVR